MNLKKEYLCFVPLYYQAACELLMRLSIACVGANRYNTVIYLYLI